MHRDLSRTSISKQLRDQLSERISNCGKSLKEIADKTNLSYGTIAHINQKDKFVSKRTYDKVTYYLLTVDFDNDNAVNATILPKEIARYLNKMEYKDQLFFFRVMQDYFLTHYPGQEIV